MMTLIRKSEEGTPFARDILRLYVKPEDLQNELIKRAMLAIEGIYKIEGLSFYSKEHGIKTPESLSNGMSTLICLSIFERHKEVLLSSNMGANVAPFVAELSLTHDFTLCDNYFLAFPFGIPLHAYDVITKKELHSSDEYHALEV